METVWPIFALVAALHMIGSVALIWLVIIPFVRKRLVRMHHASRP